MEFTHIANPVRVEAHVVKSFRVYDSDGNGEVVLEDGSSVDVTAGMLARYAPKQGDYIVTQEDGYVYVNPKDVFERKYSAIVEGA